MFIKLFLFINAYNMNTKSLTLTHKEFTAEISLLDLATSEYNVAIRDSNLSFSMNVHPRFGCVSSTNLDIDARRFLEIARSIIGHYSLPVLVDNKQIILGMTLDEDLQPQYLIPMPSGEFARYTPTKGVYWFGLRDCCEDDYEDFFYTACGEIDKHRAAGHYDWNV
jgi:hypothetical protein